MLAQKNSNNKGAIKQVIDFMVNMTCNKTPSFVTLLLSSWFCSMSENARFGFVSFAETWNGRLAMLGFVIGLGTELLTGQGILTQIGLG
ncbi:hypothetical protein CREGCYN_16570 [Synechococcus sp. M16CYN]